jgi:hypothetical protein
MVKVVETLPRVNGFFHVSNYMCLVTNTFTSVKSTTSGSSCVMAKRCTMPRAVL